MRKLLILPVILLLLFSFTRLSSIPISDTSTPIATAAPSQTFAPFPPMYITSDADFETLGWLGDGSPGAPYYVTNFEISNLAYGACITIENTRAHFMILNCQFSADEIGYAIYMNNVTNGLIEFCTTGTNTHCIYGNASSDITLNSLTLPSTCVIFEQSWQCSVLYSTISYAPGDGVFFDDCSQMTVQGCAISDCAASGISLHNTGESVISENTVQDNTLEQIYISGTSSNSYIYDNVIYTGTEGVRDSGSSNIWDNNVDRGNWWSDYTGTGTYIIPGSAGSIDRYPRGPSTNTPTSTTTTTTTTTTSTTSETTTTNTSAGTGEIVITDWVPMDFSIRVVLSLAIGVSYGALVMVAFNYFRRRR